MIPADDIIINILLCSTVATLYGATICFLILILFDGDIVAAQLEELREEMPPNTKDRVIVVGLRVKEPHYYYGNFINSAITKEDAANWQWTPYTP